MQEKPMSEIRVYPGTISDSGGNKIIFTVDTSQGETQEAYEHRCQKTFKLALSFVVPSRPTSEIVDTYKYRKVGEHSYEIVTPGYESKEETGSERDTHFLGFARALLNEILDEWEGNLSLGKDLYPQDNERVAQHIARRAYDLACHTLYETSYGLDRFYIPERINETVPDLTEWPK